MTLAEGILAGATLLGPLVAVQITRYLDEEKEKRGRKLWVFKTLMATRAYTVSPVHVEALNRIDLEFDVEHPKEKAVVAAWRQYLDLLGTKGMSEEQWALRRSDLLVDLLFHMGHALNYDFDKTQIRNGTYSPIAHGRLEEQQAAIRQGVIDLMDGKRAIPVLVTGAPPADK